jgi:hypothetical protein
VHLQAEASIRDELLDRSQVNRLKSELAAEQSRVAEAEDVAARLAAELEVRGAVLGRSLPELNVSAFRLPKLHCKTVSRSWSS